MSSQPVEETPREHTVATLSGFFAATALLFSLIAIVYHPVPVGFAAVLLALIASGMSARHQALCFWAVCVSSLCFVAGVVIAVTTNNPLW